MTRRERAAWAVVGAGTTLLVAGLLAAAVAAWNTAWRWAYTGKIR